MSVTIILSEPETYRIWCAAQLNVNRNVEIGESVHPENYTREENRILSCIARKHKADYIQLRKSVYAE